MCLRVHWVPPLCHVGGKLQLVEDSWQLHLLPVVKIHKPRKIRKSEHKKHFKIIWPPSLLMAALRVRS